LTQFAHALAGGEIRVIDLSQPLDAKTAVIQLPPEIWKIGGRSIWKKFPNTMIADRPGTEQFFLRRAYRDAF